MREQNPIEQNPIAAHNETLRCEPWECLIADALDGTLPAGDAAALERHSQGCADCAYLLEEARQGAQWLDYLEDEPETPSDMVEKILAHTGGAVDLPSPARAKMAAPSSPSWLRVAPPIAQRVIEPRLMMTVAMAFFSLALTLNLTGIKLSEVRLSDLRPSALSATLTRQYYSAHGRVVRYYESLRLVNEMEARVRELRQSTETEPAPAPPEKPSPVSRNGSSGSNAPESAADHAPPPREESPLGNPSGNPGNPGNHTFADVGLANEATRNGAMRDLREPLDPSITASRHSQAAQQERAGNADEGPSTTQAPGERNLA